MDPIDLSPLSFIIDNTCLTGLLNIMVGKKHIMQTASFLSDLHNSFSINSSVPCKSQIDRHHPKVHLFFSDLSILPINVAANIRHLEQYNKHQLIIKAAFIYSVVH
ncbi:unnamed protein product [Rotaria sp. Silwood2]|nr:unnamed protein product [Rotaria sp. Silwood2]CAF2696064.1 unnamed protein product [Rotaria sp. Silwood2]CAF4462603.1 unnamed protein product [Rotaria sp. Silwood2]CAF4465159.1 unnamed protein product [Rotaria sp. Silwood2]